MPLLAGSEAERLAAATGISWVHPDTDWTRGVLDEWSLVPGLLPATVQVQAVQTSGDRAQVRAAVKRPEHFEVVLRRGPDGTWGVDLYQTIPAAAPAFGARFKHGYEHALSFHAQRQDQEQQLRWTDRYRITAMQALLGEYAEGHGGTLPPADEWRDAIEDYCLDKARLEFIHELDGKHGVALNASWAGKRLPEGENARGRAILLFETDDTSRNAVGDPARNQSRSTEGTPSAWITTGEGRVLGVPDEMSAVERAARYADERLCRHRLKALCAAFCAYEADHDGELPLSDTWCDDIWPYLPVEERKPEVFVDPAVPELEYGFAMNVARSAQNLRDTPTDAHNQPILVPSVRGMRSEALSLPMAAPDRHLLVWRPWHVFRGALVAALPAAVSEVPAGGAIEGDEEKGN